MKYSWVGKLCWFMSHINRNIPTTWRWACGDRNNSKTMLLYLGEHTPNGRSSREGSVRVWCQVVFPSILHRRGIDNNLGFPVGKLHEKMAESHQLMLLILFCSYVLVSWFIVVLCFPCFLVRLSSNFFYSACCSLHFVLRWSFKVDSTLKSKN